MRIKNLIIKLYSRLPQFLQTPTAKAKAKRIYYLLKHKFRIGYFKIILLETYSDCNRDCWFCWRKMDRSGVRKDKEGNHIKIKMPAGTVLNIIDQVYDLGYTGEIALHLLNEPTLDDRIFAFAKYARFKGMSPSLTTNGDTFRSRDDKEYFDMITECFNRIHIGQYEFSNEDERAEDRIRLLRKLYKAKFVDFWGGERQATRGMDKEKFERKYGIRVSDLVKSAREKPCLAPGCQINIRYDGKIMSCCSTDEFIVGDIYKESIEDYWFSKKHIHLVNTLRRKGGRKQFEICKNCPDNADFPEDVQAKIDKEKKEKKSYYYATPFYKPKNNLNYNLKGYNKDN